VDGPPDAPALVLSNSLGSTLAIWDRLLPELARHFRVIRYDLRGHGASPVPAPPYAIEDLGTDVLELLDRIDVPRAHLCGVSIGGLVSMWIAAHAPDRVERLVLCCTSPRFPSPEAWFERAATVRAEGTEAVADAVVARWFTAGYAARHPGVVDEMRAMIASTPAVGYAACCEVVGTADLRPDLTSIRATTLVVAGADDPAVPADDVDALARGIPGTRVVVLPDAAHLAIAEQPERVTELIGDHLRATEEEG